MTTLAIRHVSGRLIAKPLVQGFVGALLALLLSLGVWQGYGWARWHAYGRNEQRLSNVEQSLGQVIRYLQAQEAAKSAGGK